MFVFVLSSLFWGFFLYAQDVQTNTALKIAELEKEKAELEKENQELKLQLEKAQKEKTELLIQLHSVDFEHLDLKLKASLLKWGLGIFLAVLTVFSLIGWYLIKDRVDRKIEGEKDKFHKAAQEIEATKKRLVTLMLAGAYGIQGVAKELTAKEIIESLEEAKSHEIVIPAITALGYKKYQDKAQANEAVQAILKYLDLGQTQDTLIYSIHALGKIGAQEAFDELIEFYQTLLEPKEIPKGANVIYIRSEIAETLGEMGKQEAIPLLKELIFEHESLESGWGNGILALKKIWERNTEARENVEATIKEICETTQIAGMKNHCLEALKTMSPEATKWAEEREAQR